MAHRTAHRNRSGRRRRLRRGPDGPSVPAIERQPVLPNAADDPLRHLTATTLIGLALFATLGWRAIRSRC